MILPTDYQRNGAGNLVDYIRRDRDQDAGATVDLRNPAGRELSDPEVNRFVDKSREFGFQRHLIVSPDPTGEYSPEEVNANTRELMNREFARQPTTDYVYGVHQNTEFPHAHVAATGEPAELEMDREDIRQMREQAAVVFEEPARTRDPTAAPRDAPEDIGRVVDEEAREQYHEAELSLNPEAEKALKRATEKGQQKDAGQPTAENASDERQTEPLSERAAERAEEQAATEREPEVDLEREQEPEREVGWWQ
ncbi:relaxase/mobilization nuclease domain-containing protein [Haloarcula sp. CBA1122]|uniref:relaxase/mobilization nuclease domain-containing protein n=1 Tax=Haloarcula sp. CBA1122 TaxID=2668069 RepID=UPI00130CC03A|nr:relaxase [Haloarcula sp. CBA1122]MUV49753.1 relaxase [Haloarcula sp. CBA1122]